MITLLSWPTPNGQKPAIMLEEIEFPYLIEKIDLLKNEQFAPRFLAVAPNNKIPAIIDDEPLGGGQLSVFESGAILTYLAEKSGRLLAPSGSERYSALEWLHWQIGGLGPMLGQLGFFTLRSDVKAPLAIARFTEECSRLIGVMDARLTRHPYLAGANYSIADIAAYPWIFAASQRMGDVLGDAFEKSSAVNAWLATIGARPAVIRGMAAH